MPCRISRAFAIISKIRKRYCMYHPFFEFAIDIKLYEVCGFYSSHYHSFHFLLFTVREVQSSSSLFIFYLRSQASTFVLLSSSAFLPFSVTRSFFHFAFVSTSSQSWVVPIPQTALHCVLSKLYIIFCFGFLFSYWYIVTKNVFPVMKIDWLFLKTKKTHKNNQSFRETVLDRNKDKYYPLRTNLFKTIKVRNIALFS